jgi:hypothetical protein
VANVTQGRSSYKPVKKDETVPAFSPKKTVRGQSILDRQARGRPSVKDTILDFSKQLIQNQGIRFVAS